MRDFFGNKKVMMILSIIVAIFLWIYVVTDQNPKIFDSIENIPVKITGVETLKERGLVINDFQKYFVDIRVYGRRNDLININKKNIIAQVDVSQLNTKGTHYLPINISGIPENVEVSRRNPEAIEITLDHIVIQEKNVEVEIKGNPSKGKSYTSYIVEPKTVQVEGPENVLNNIRNVVATIDISNADKDVTMTLPLKAIDNSGQKVEDIKINPSTVNVTISIEPTKTVSVTPNIVGELPEGYEISNINLSSSNVLIGGNQSHLNTIKNISTEEIDISDKTKSFEQQVKLLLPEGIKVINNDETITVKINIKSYPEKSFEVENIDVLNLNEGFSIQEDITKQLVKITLSGSKDGIESLKEENISPYINLKNLGEGQHNVPVQLKLPEGILLKNIEPKSLTIHILKKSE